MPETYLTFITIEDTTFKFSGKDLLYSTDSAITWNELLKDEPTETIEVGEKVMWKGNNEPLSGGSFSSTGLFKVEGTPMSLIYGDDLTNKSLSGYTEAFQALFKDCTTIESASGMTLPATTLSTGCYREMFYGCTSLKSSPRILPARKVEDYCYYRMFYDCTSLETAPVSLPAIEMKPHCYHSMFQNCTKLTTAPHIIAKTMSRQSCQSMFSGCVKLNNIICLSTDITASGSVAAWTANVSDEGRFTKRGGMNAWTTGNNGIPENWDVINDNTKHIQFIRKSGFEDDDDVFNSIIEKLNEGQILDGELIIGMTDKGNAMFGIAATSGGSVFYDSTMTEQVIEKERDKMIGDIIFV